MEPNKKRKNMVTITCSVCDEKFSPSKEEIQNNRDGLSELPKICDDCYHLAETSGLFSLGIELYMNSDADPGL